MKSLDLIRELSLAGAISGCEREIVNILDKYISHASEIRKDKMGSVNYIFTGKASRPRIMLIAHMDEIGFIVSKLEDSGFLRIHPVGGWNPDTLLSSMVEVINRRGERYPGVIGSVPVHFLKDKNENVKLEIKDMFVDIGARSLSDLEDNFAIRLGDQVLPLAHFFYQQKNETIISKAFDDRIGIAALVAIARWLADNEHPNEVHCFASVQEEVGTRGARTAALYSNADICIVLEGAPADDIPGIGDYSQTAVGKGVHLRLYDPALLVKRELRDFMIETAEKHKIRYQQAVRKYGRTDGGEIQTANYGTPAIVLGVPVRYAHSHQGIICLTDYQELLKFLQIILSELDMQAWEIIRG